MSIVLSACQFQEPVKNHGINFIENRSKKLIVNKSNQNDVLSIFGEPHWTSYKDTKKWLYIERTITKGEFHKLGQNVLKDNNVLVLNFNKYGILKDKVLLDKNDINNLDFSETETENKLTEKSFIERFLSSIKTKMYGNK